MRTSSIFASLSVSSGGSQLDSGPDHAEDHSKIFGRKSEYSPSEMSASGSESDGTQIDITNLIKVPTKRMV